MKRRLHIGKIIMSIGIIAILFFPFGDTAEAAISSGLNTSATTASDGAGSPVAPTWGTSFTSTGSLLVASFSSYGAPGAITPPAGKGWTQIGSNIVNGNENLAVFYIANAAPQTGVQNWAYAGAPDAIGVVMYEVKGIALSGPLDQNATSIGSSTTPTSGTITTMAAKEVIIAIYGQSRLGNIQPAFSAPTNSFSLIKGAAANIASAPAKRNTSAIYSRIVALTQTGLSTAITSSINDVWASMIISFWDVAPGAGGGKPHILIIQ